MDSTSFNDGQQYAKNLPEENRTLLSKKTIKTLRPNYDDIQIDSFYCGYECGCDNLLFKHLKICQWTN
jgi:hypothetical protein